jgi:hypothetical protein
MEATCLSVCIIMKLLINMIKLVAQHIQIFSDFFFCWKIDLQKQ